MSDVGRACALSDCRFDCPFKPVCFLNKAEREPKAVCTENLTSNIVVVKAAKDRKRTDDARALHEPRERRIFV